MRRLTALAALATAALVVACLGGPASAAGLTRVKVQRISAKVAATVVRQQAAGLQVARAADADRLAGRSPHAYLDRVVSGTGPSDVRIGAISAVIAGPLRLTVPEGIESVHVTGVSAFQGSDTPALLYVVRGTSCTDGPWRTPPSYGASGYPARSLTVDQVLPVSPGVHTFVLCGLTDMQSSVWGPSLTVETVAAGPTG